ncbi:MAG: hypothetical protein E6I90_14490 [Chloroflexi bacterium]|nr:MAG: hypothetical protein E6I90_14490 [Chloroflexota bacterium]
MSKTKIRCNTCGKWFQSANAKEVTCPDCLQKARKEKMAAKAAPPSAGKAATATATSAALVDPEAIAKAITVAPAVIARAIIAALLPTA